ncbi:hypothetical protein OV079_52205 [Nannocystis pusilla]|uniref:Uncharacterized protein n=1 Tax=Nannocystis pusilla TaxID=889268 RepID=A0A9X3F2A5_9BACT|nr:hypothetical protein [Nannocystis pusilla]MCY1013955.1 hypothetical protein [Nannocystis pusilla]
MNLQGPLNRHRFMLSIGAHPIRAAGGLAAPRAGGVQITIAEVVTPQDEEAGPHEDELWLLEQVWIERTSPFGENGYNVHTRIRDA